MGSHRLKPGETRKASERRFWRGLGRTRRYRRKNPQRAFVEEPVNVPGNLILPLLLGKILRPLSFPEQLLVCQVAIPVGNAETGGHCDRLVSAVEDQFGDTSAETLYKLHCQAGIRVRHEKDILVPAVTVGVSMPVDVGFQIPHEDWEHEQIDMCFP